MSLFFALFAALAVLASGMGAAAVVLAALGVSLEPESERGVAAGSGESGWRETARLIGRGWRLTDVVNPYISVDRALDGATDRTLAGAPPENRSALRPVAMHGEGAGQAARSGCGV